MLFVILTKYRLSQVQDRILEWNLILPDDELSVPSPSPTLSDDWEIVASPPKSEAFTSTPYTPSDPAQMSEYSKKPLPSLPAPKIQQKSSKIQKKRPSTRDRLKLTCHHGPKSSDVHDVQKSLESIPDGTSMIDRYNEEEQAYEQLALGLSGRLVMRGYRRATDSSSSTVARHRWDPRVRKHSVDRNKESNEGKGNSSPDGGPSQPDDDGPERKERRKTPPSPCGEI
jgi:hypothetical protein